MNLVDERTGVIRRLRSLPVPAQLPRSFEIIASELSDTTRFSPWPSDSAGAGYALGDPEAAHGAAIGEAVERYCGNLVPPGLVTGSRAELVAAGLPALDPARVALFSAEQYAEPGFPFRPMDSALPLDWAEGVDLATGGRVLVPASLVWVSYVAASVAAGRPATNPIIQAGLAAGRGRAAAEYSALCEVLERDAVARAWHGRGRVRAVRPPDWLARLGHGARRTLTTRYFEFGSEFGPVTVGALVRDAETGYLTMGTACRADPVAALRKVFAEACQLQMFVAEYDDPESPYMLAARNPDSPLSPWRPDRDYLAAYRPDFRDVVDYGCHLQLYLDPLLQERFEAELADAVTGEVDHAALAGCPDGLPHLVDRLAAAGHPVLSVDVTTEDVAPTGLSVVRILVPGLYSNSAAGLPFLGGTRIDPATRRALPLPH
ncbi:YcaO-like family protein [Amycolatopsis anabasis]|uniref:YcaO-like family protein n=1 Tax=Amycolatopsis anabasis TaxID=1840409 RepID=UPI00131EC504|nr:YcaO-like family protein [Amycolatopsis anabasis]